jgi:ADP-ribosyl-[dinitrogen reductase] hydrolase
MMDIDNAMGMYMGMAIGDALGAPLEFTQGLPDDQIRSFKYRTGGAHNVSIGEWTDDTAMARAITDSYITKERFDSNFVYAEWNNWVNYGQWGTRDYCFDKGATCSQAINNWVIGHNGFEHFGVSDESAQGNGGIMRLCPTVIANLHDETSAVLDAVRQSMMTHRSTVCTQYAAMLARDLWHGKLISSTENEILNRKTENSGWVVDTYYSAWQAVLTTNNFASAVRKAVSRGNDADTVGAVAGMIAGRIYGYSEIPTWAKDDLMLRFSLECELKELYDFGLSSF